MARAVISAMTSNQDNDHPRTELDSHADSPVVGKNCKILHYTGQQVNVAGFSDTLGECKSIPVVNCALAYDCTITQQTYILLIYNALYMKTMEVNLIPPFLMRLNGIEVNECPKFMSSNPSIKDHSIYFPEHNERIPLQLQGIVSYFPSRKPDEDEMYKHLHFDLTPPKPTWNPHDTTYSSQESSMLTYDGEIHGTKTNGNKTSTIAATNIANEPDQSYRICSVLQNISSTLNVDQFAYNVSNIKYSIKSIRSGKRNGITAKALSDLW